MPSFNQDVDPGGNPVDFSLVDSERRISAKDGAGRPSILKLGISESADLFPIARRIFSNIPLFPCLLFFRHPPIVLCSCHPKLHQGLQMQRSSQLRWPLPCGVFYPANYLASVSFGLEMWGGELTHIDHFFPV